MRAEFHRAFASIVVMAFLSSELPAQDAPKAAPKKNAPSKSKNSVASLTGCVDEQDGQYILVNDHTLSPIANLEADGFPTEGFAKHMGHKVTVRGTSSTDGPKPVFRVRTIETVSETCAPQLQP